MKNTHSSAHQRNTTVLKRVLKHARPEISERLKGVSQKIRNLLGQKTSQKIHLKIDLNDTGSSAIELSSKGLIASEYGRQYLNENGIVRQTLSEINLGSPGDHHDE